MNSNSVIAWCNHARILLARFMRAFVVLMMVFLVAGAVWMVLRKDHWAYPLITLVIAGTQGFSWLHLTRWIRMKTTVIKFGEHWQTYDSDLVNVHILEVQEDEDGDEVVVFQHRRDGAIRELSKWDFLVTFCKVEHPLLGNP